jgi:hypothetical protein
LIRHYAQFASNAAAPATVSAMSHGAFSQWQDLPAPTRQRLPVDLIAVQRPALD